MKKSLFAFFVFALLTQAKAWNGYYDFVVGNLAYSITSVDKRTVSVSETLYDEDGIYVIPEEVEYNGVKFTVDNIGFLAFDSYWAKSVTIPPSVKDITQSGFYNSDKTIETLIIKDSPDILDCTMLHGVNDYDGGQFTCTIIKYLYLGRDLTYVPYSEYYRDYRPFGYPNKMETLEVGQYVKDLSHLSLEYCNNLSNVILHTTEPPVAPSFSNLQYVNVNVTVPRGTLNKYKASTTWKSFINLKESEENTSKITLDYDNESGSVFVNRQPADKEFSVENGSNIELMLIPAMGKVVSGLYVNGENKLPELTNNVILLTNITSNTTIKIVFSAPNHTVKMMCGIGGAYCLSVEDGSSLDVIIEEEDGWMISSVYVNNVDKTNELSNKHLHLKNISTDCKITAIFEEDSPDAISAYSNNINNAEIRLNGRNMFFLNASESIKKIYDSSGKLIYSGTEDQYTVPDSGIYIVVLNSNKYKIAM
ncbi:MAG: hypothetical protein IJS63_02190 [Bacteroidaceae bacterium]|nr:hypothetical protein [Bacteroidaceae bacterium]